MALVSVYRQASSRIEASPCSPSTRVRLVRSDVIASSRMSRSRSARFACGEVVMVDIWISRSGVYGVL